MHAVLYLNNAPIVVDVLNTEALMPLISILTATVALPVTPVVDDGVVVGTAVIDEVGEIVIVDVAV